jgi:tRNA wybutosine-synthesizing protein 4
MGISSTNYTLLGTDLRTFESGVIPLLKQHGFVPTLPTFVIAECVLVYLAPAVSTSIVKNLSALLPHTVMVTYDPIGPSDAFGKMMVSNLKERNLDLPGFVPFGDLDSQKRRFLEGGWNVAKAMDMNDIYETWTSPAEKERVSGLENMDELEEWRLLTKHYALCWAFHDGNSSGIFDSYHKERYTVGQ